MLLYPVYTLLFGDTGLSVWQISSLFVIWSACSLIFEVPSGALADATSRRGLLIVAPLLPAVAFAMWVSTPCYWVFAFGFVLWGLKGALASGALEALVYDELFRIGATDRYARLMGRGQAAGVIAAMLTGFLAAPVVAAGGFAAAAAASVVICLLTAVLASLFPEQRVRREDVEPAPDWATALRAGFGEATGSPGMAAAVILVAIVASVWGALDEYTPLLIDATGAEAADVSLLMALVWAGAAAGGLAAGRADRFGQVPLAAVITAGAVLLAGGALVRHPAGAIAIAIAFGVFQLATVVADTRLQNRISGDARATVTSVAGMSTDVATLLVYVAYATLADTAGHSGAFAVLALPYLVVAAWLVARRAHHRH